MLDSVRPGVYSQALAVSARASYVVLLTELLGERGAHDVAARVGRGGEVSLSRLSSRRGDSCIQIVRARSSGWRAA